MSRATIGLEVHVQLTELKSKLFCSCSADYRGAPPNTHVCPVCLGLPGSLPVPNRRAVEQAIAVCLALRGRVAGRLVFERKHYFYPDLPKNYQITQYSEPICRGGWVEVERGGRTRRIGIRRVNLEEDPGRIVYPTGSILTSPYVLVDYNRSGVALLEIVTEPVIEGPEEAELFLYELRSILEHLGVCRCGLEGAMRVDANISIDGGERVEVKNIGSISDVRRALAYEIARQRALLARGERVRRETRHWDSVRHVTLPGRVKEVEEDYRYMLDPNLPPTPISLSLVEAVRRRLPELPRERVERLQQVYGLPPSVARVLVRLSKKLADFYENAAKSAPRHARWIANYLVNDLLPWLGEDLERKLYSTVRPEYLASLAELVDKGVLSIRQAKEIAPEIAVGRDPVRLVEEKGLRRLVDREVIERVVEEVFEEYPRAVEDALVKPKAVDFLVGMVMRKTGGRADPIVARSIVEEKLREIRLRRGKTR